MRVLPVWIGAAWWGSLSTLMFFVVPLLFVVLPSAAMAGNLAAKLFTVQAYLSTGCGALLLLMFTSRKSWVQEATAQRATLFVIAGMLMALLVEFAVAPHIVARDNLPLWHGVGTVMIVVQWLCACFVLGKLVLIREG